MSGLSPSEQEAWREARERPWKQGGGSGEKQFPPTPEGRYQYAQFATVASQFFREVKPVRFGGKRWRL